MNIMIVIIILPILILLLFFYRRDKHEKEPFIKVVESFIIGVFIILQIDYLQNILLQISLSSLYQSFIVASFTEEIAKFIAAKYTIYKDVEFDEQIDGIVYIVAISLGFALVENLSLVTSYSEGLVRAVTAIPAQCLFGVTMGYYLGKYKFNKDKKLIVKAILIPILLHGIYDYLIMSGTMIALLLFIPYVVFLWIKALKDTEISLKNSKFRR